MSPEEQRRYNKYLEDLASDRGALQYAREEGIELGLKQGIEQGKQSRDVAIVKNMYNQGIEPDIICRVTGLSIGKVQDIIQGSDL